MSNAKDVQHFWEDDLSEDERPLAFQVDDGDENDDEDGDTSAIPTSAAEYLRIVRRQASAMPNVFVAKSVPALATAGTSLQTVRESNAIASTRMAPMPEFACPDARWKQQLLDWFSSLKETLLEKKRTLDLDEVKRPRRPRRYTRSPIAWKHIIFDDKSDIEPEGSELLCLEYGHISAALESFDIALEDVHSIPASGDVSDECKQDGRRICDRICSGHCSKWMFSLLANLQLPLQGQMAGTLRSILRKLTFARLAVESRNDERLATLNVLIVILAHHFGQGANDAFKPSIS